MRTSIYLLFLTSFTCALEVSPDSPCSPKCIDDPRTGNASSRDDSLTFNRDLFCFDWEVSGANSTQSGLKFRDCNNCLKSSGYAETTWNERDVGWFLCTSISFGRCRNCLSYTASCLTSLQSIIAASLTGVSLVASEKNPIKTSPPPRSTPPATTDARNSIRQPIIWSRARQVATTSAIPLETLLRMQSHV